MLIYDLQTNGGVTWMSISDVFYTVVQLWNIMFIFSGITFSLLVEVIEREPEELTIGSPSVEQEFVSDTFQADHVIDEQLKKEMHQLGVTEAKESDNGLFSCCLSLLNQIHHLIINKTGFLMLYLSYLYPLFTGTPVCIYISAVLYISCQWWRCLRLCQWARGIFVDLFPGSSDWFVYV